MTNAMKHQCDSYLGLVFKRSNNIDLKHSCVNFKSSIDGRTDCVIP